MARQFSERVAINPEHSCGLRHQQIRGYHPYRGGLRLWDGVMLQGLEQASPLVQSLSTPAATAWLIHPREIQKDLRKALDHL